MSPSTSLYTVFYAYIVVYGYDNDDNYIQRTPAKAPRKKSTDLQLHDHLPYVFQNLVRGFWIYTL